MALHGSESSDGQQIESGSSLDAGSRVMTAGEISAFRERMDLVLQQVVRELRTVLGTGNTDFPETASSSPASPASHRAPAVHSPERDQRSLATERELHAQIDALKRQLLEEIESDQASGASTTASAVLESFVPADFTHSQEDNDVR